MGNTCRRTSDMFGLGTSRSRDVTAYETSIDESIATTEKQLQKVNVELRRHQRAYEDLQLEVARGTGPIRPDQKNRARLLKQRVVFSGRIAASLGRKLEDLNLSKYQVAEAVTNRVTANVAKISDKLVRDVRPREKDVQKTLDRRAESSLESSRVAEMITMDGQLTDSLMVGDSADDVMDDFMAGVQALRLQELPSASGRPGEGGEAVSISIRDTASELEALYGS